MFHKLHKHTTLNLWSMLMVHSHEHAPQLVGVQHEHAPQHCGALLLLLSYLSEYSTAEHSLWSNMSAPQCTCVAPQHECSWSNVSALCSTQVALMGVQHECNMSFT